MRLYKLSYLRNKAHQGSHKIMHLTSKIVNLSNAEIKIYFTFAECIYISAIASCCHLFNFYIIHSFHQFMSRINERFSSSISYTKNAVFI